MPSEDTNEDELMKYPRPDVFEADTEPVAHFDNPQFSDFLIHTSNRTFRVHKVVLYRGSEYFRRLFGNGWKEIALNEVTFKDDDPVALEAMLRYIYGLNCNFKEVEHGDVEIMLFNAHLFTVAAKYGVKVLEQISLRIFDLFVDSHCEDGETENIIQAMYGTTAAFNPRITGVLCMHVEKNITRLMKRYEYVQAFRDFPRFSLAYMEYVDDYI